MVTPEEHLVHLEDKSPRVTNTRRSSVKCFAWILRWSLNGWLKSLLGSLDWSEAWRREGLSSRSVGSKGFQVSGVAKWTKGVWASFYSPKRNLLVGVSEIRICPGWGRTCPPNVFGTQTWHRSYPVLRLNPSYFWEAEHVRRTLLEPGDPAG
jgi:hypothetical protein